MSNINFPESFDLTGISIGVSDHSQVDNTHFKSFGAHSQGKSFAATHSKQVKHSHDHGKHGDHKKGSCGKPGGCGKKTVHEWHPHVNEDDPECGPDCCCEEKPCEDSDPGCCCEEKPCEDSDPECCCESSEECGDSDPECCCEEECECPAYKFKVEEKKCGKLYDFEIGHQQHKKPTKYRYTVDIIDGSFWIKGQQCATIIFRKEKNYIFRCRYDKNKHDFIIHEKGNKNKTLDITGVVYGAKLTGPYEYCSRTSNIKGGLAIVE